MKLSLIENPLTFIELIKIVLTSEYLASTMYKSGVEFEKSLGVPIKINVLLAVKSPALVAVYVPRPK